MLLYPLTDEVMLLKRENTNLMKENAKLRWQVESYQEKIQKRDRQLASCSGENGEASKFMQLFKYFSGQCSMSNLYRSNVKG